MSKYILNEILLLKISSLTKKLITRFFILFIALASLNAMAETDPVAKNVAAGQDKVITGTVVAEDTGEPLPGVNILIKGTTIGTVTDIDGKFSIISDMDEIVLEVSYVGYTTQDVTVTPGTPVDIKLIQDVYGLEELVVIGYGMEKKSLVTGAISSIQADDISNSSIQRTEQALQGKTAGVYVLPISGSPGAGMKVRIRGAGSSGNSQPLYIVDGIKTTDINYLEPGDIERVEVLKDAASSAIYGAEGGNGVVIISTKTGKPGKAKIDYSFQYGTQTVGNLPELMNATQYRQYMTEGGQTISGDANTDWLGELFEPAPMQKHHLSFSSGNESSSLLTSLSYLNQDGILGGDKAKFERITGRLNFDHKINKYVNVGAKIVYSSSNRAAVDEDNEFGGVLSSALMIDPLTPTHYGTDTMTAPKHFRTIVYDGNPVRKDEDGRYFAISPNIAGEAVNPLLLLDISKGSTKADEIVGNFDINLTPFKGFTFTSRAGIDYTHSNHHFWNPSYYYSSERNNSTTGVLEETFTQKKWQWENFANYSTRIGAGDISITAGMAAEQLTYNYLNVSKGPMIVEDETYAQLNYTTVTSGDIDGNLFEEKLVSYFGRASYDYRDKYLLQATIRYDGASTSLLNPDHNWGAFPSFSAGWVLSEEDFFPQTDLLSFVKIRGSWGQNGSLANLKGVWKDYDDFSPYSRIENSQFIYLPAVTSEGIRYPLPGGGYITGAEPGVLENSELTWETSQQTDIGIDLRSLEGMISLSADYYIKETKDLLAYFDLPASTGNNPPFINAGDVKNSGVELNLGLRNISGKLKYSVDVNFATLKNEVTRLDATVPRITGMRIGTTWREATSFELGEPIWYFRGYKTNGIDPATGDPVFVDVDGDGSITPADQTNIGNPHPKFLYGGNINLEYMGIDFSIFLQGVGGNDVMLGWIRTDRNTANRPAVFYEDRWTTANANASMPRAIADDRAYRSDLLVFDGDYMRVKQIQVGYNLPSSLIKPVGMGRLRVYVSLDDYFTFTKYIGMDPEAGSEDDASLGIDRGVYPIPKKMMFGVNVTF